MSYLIAALPLLLALGVLALQHHANLRLGRPCPLCGEQSRRALMGVFPIWACMNERAHDHDGHGAGPCLHGFWSLVAIRASMLFPSRYFSFLTCPDTFWWWPRALWIAVTGRGYVREGE